MTKRSFSVLWGFKPDPPSLDSALGRSLYWAFWVSTLFGTPGVLLVFALKLVRGDAVVPAVLVPVVYLSGLGGMLLLKKRWSVRVTGGAMAAWLGAIAIVSEYSDALHVGAMVCWLVSAVVCALFVGLPYLMIMIGAMMLSSLIAYYLHQQSVSFVFIGITLAFSMGGVGVALRVFRLLLVEAFEREVQLREQVIAADEARLHAERTMQAGQHFAVLGRVAAGIAHDVNNVLTVVLSTADLLRMGLPEKETEACLADMKSIAEETAASTRELLSYAPKSRCVPRLVCPAEVVERMARTLRRVLPDKVSLEWRTSGRRAVLMDPADLQRVVLNLVVNARDAMPEGGRLELLVEDCLLQDGRPGVSIIISDTGEGMAPEVLRRLFEPFFTTKAPGKGTGLGLKMVRQMIEEAGGGVSVASAPGEGSRFILSIPGQDLASAPQSARPIVGRGSGGRILLVEDKAGLLKLAMRILERGGYRVDAAPSVEIASRLIDEGAGHDMLFIDGDIGATSAVTILQRFQVRNPKASRLICVGALLDQGLADFITKESVSTIEKPFSANELLQEVESLLG